MTDNNFAEYNIKIKKNSVLGKLLHHKKFDGIFIKDDVFEFREQGAPVCLLLVFRNKYVKKDMYVKTWYTKNLLFTADQKAVDQIVKLIIDECETMEKVILNDMSPEKGYIEND